MELECFKKANLTQRETEVALYILRGISNKEIQEAFAKEKGINVEMKTIKFHIGNLYSKTWVSSRSQFIVKFLTPQIKKLVSKEVDSLKAHVEHLNEMIGLDLPKGRK